MPSWALTSAIGFLSGVLSGMFGIGGGVITTPALRLVLHTSELVAVGTPLPVILPSAVTGAIAYSRRGLADVRAGVTIGLVGSAFAVAGALAAVRVGGRFVLVTTAALMVYMAVDMTLQAIAAQRAATAGTQVPPDRTAPSEATRESAGEGRGETASQAPANANDTRGLEAASDRIEAARAPSLPGLALLGAVTGLYSGFLGLGGGFILVPMLSRLFRFPIKRAVGTSLVAVGLLAVPGSIGHYFLGNVDVRLTLLLIVGVIPGALVGARVTFGASERFVRIGFAALLAVVGALLAASELGWLG